MKSDNKVTLQVSDGSIMDAYVSFPEGDGPFPGIIVLQEAFGVNNHIRNIADRFANEGFVAIAPELFHRTARGFESGYTDFSLVAPHFHAINAEGLIADLQATYQWFQQEKKVNATKIFSIGYCLGGRVSFLANTILPLTAAISYYGGGIPMFIDRVKQIHAPHLFFWGGLDKHIPVEQIDSVKKAMDEAGKKYSSILFPEVDHGFNCDERASYDEAASKEAWRMVQKFLKTSLK
jgi:carboxymethylenebutenolidase